LVIKFTSRHKDTILQREDKTVETALEETVPAESLLPKTAKEEEGDRRTGNEKDPSASRGMLYLIILFLAGM
jgi:hypothetical protein